VLPYRHATKGEMLSDVADADEVVWNFVEIDRKVGHPPGC